MKQFVIITLILCATPTTAVAAVPDQSGAPVVPREFQELILNGAARDRLRGEYDQLLSRSNLTPSEQIDFQTFLARLDGRIAQQCHDLLLQYPELDISELPCPRTPAPNASSIDLTSERTPRESVAALDRELSAGLGEFDEMLLKEQEKISARPSASANGGPGGLGGSAETGDSDAQEGQNGATSEASSAAERFPEEEEIEGTESKETSPNGTRDRAEGSSVAGDPKRVPPRTSADIPDGSDDDIVARQIREAAEKETDPELKRKLWEEYRRYKASKS